MLKGFTKAEKERNEKLRKRYTIVKQVIGLDFGMRGLSVSASSPIDGIVNIYEDNHKELHTYVGNKTIIKQLK